MTTVKGIIGAAAREVGMVERPVNLTKYGAWYGMDGQSWCAMFISWLFRYNLSAIGGKFAYTPTFAQHFRDAGRFGKAPRVGAIVFYDFPDSVDRIQHVGLVTAYDRKTITTIEGNTSSGAHGSQSNGGGVYRRVRPRDRSIVGYGYPAYDEPKEFRVTKTMGAHTRASWLSPGRHDCAFERGQIYPYANGKVGDWRKLSIITKSRATVQAWAHISHLKEED